MEETQGKKEEQMENIPTTPKNPDVEDNKLVAAMSYIFVLVFVPLFLKRESPFCQFHAKQGLAMFMVCIVGMFVFPIPVFGWALGITVAALDIIAIFKTLQGEKWEIPVIGDIAKKINV